MTYLIALHAVNPMLPDRSIIYVLEIRLRTRKLLNKVGDADALVVGHSLTHNLCLFDVVDRAGNETLTCRYFAQKCHRSSSVQFS